MNKKKVAALLVAGVLSIGAIGGTLAWFTSQDSVTNAFQTGDTDKPGESDSGIDIEENFKPEDAGNVTPGDTVTKEVKVTNTASYKQLIRAKIEKVWKITEKTADGKTVEKVVTHYVTGTKTVKDDQGNDVVVETVEYLTPEKASTEGAQPLDASLIILNFGTNISETNPASTGKWIDNSSAQSELGADKGYYYYNGIVESKASTSNLLEKVTLSGKASNIYKNLNFDVIVTAEGVQASNGAVSETWKTAPEAIKDLGE